MNRVSYKVALGGVISSLCLFAMFLTGIMPFLYLTLPMAAGALLIIIVMEVNASWAFLTYVAVSLLSLFVTFDKEAALVFILLFGHYPIIKPRIDKIKNQILRFLAKFGIFNVCVVLDYQLTIHLLGISDMTEDFSDFGKYGIFILWIFVDVILLVYDYALGGCIDLYVRFLKPKIYGSKQKKKKINNCVDIRKK